MIPKEVIQKYDVSTRRLEAMSNNFLVFGLEDLDETPVRFKCKECGDCCRTYQTVHILPHEVKRMSECLKITPKEFLENYCTIQDLAEPPVFMLQNGFGCVFFKNSKCIIHKCKPDVCRLAPCYLQIYGVMFAPYCNGFGSGDLLNPKELSEKVLERVMKLEKYKSSYPKREYKDISRELTDHYLKIIKKN